MTDIFESAVRKYRGSPSVLILFILAVIMFSIGLNHFVEDTYSSKYGLENLERAYSLNIQIFQWSYWTMSLAPQIASMVFGYLYLSDTTKKWALWTSLGSQGMDFFADSWYRSNGQLFAAGDVFAVSSLLTFVYFSVGSEFFLTIGGGLILKLFAPAIATWKQAAKSVKQAGNGEYVPREEIHQDKRSKHFDRLPKHNNNRPIQQTRPDFRPASRPSDDIPAFIKAKMGSTADNIDWDIEQREPTYHPVGMSRNE